MYERTNGMIERISLNGAWRMRPADSAEWMPATVPGSVYSDMLANGRMEDPYWRDNENKAFDLMENDYIYARSFDVTEQQLSGDALILNCLGLDTLATICINGQEVAYCDNMHRIWEVDIKPYVHVGENDIEIRFASPLKYMREQNKLCYVEGSCDCTEGFPHIRKAHCMMGWDWGPRLPDAGIWRDIELLTIDLARLISVRIHQEHAEDGSVTLSFEPEIKPYGGRCACKEPEYSVKITVTAPDGCELVSDGAPITIAKPELWWPNGYGAQPLYSVKACLFAEGRELDAWSARIGLRTMTMSRDKDEHGESFTLTVNGVRVFSMGADYIPEDNIFPRITEQRTRRLLEDCRLANYNSIRVWGGGYYPDEWFYDACDELGLVVWQDFMFACSMYELSPAFEANIRGEFVDNIRRLRHHASLGLWCGNNEMEIAVLQEWYKFTPKQYADYIKMYEYIIPQELAKHDPDTFYWPASPSSGGSFDNPSDPDRGDVHYWEVWHGNKPFTEYRKYLFRYVSEFGFQSFPCMKTIESFTLPEDRNIFSYIMEKHQRNDAANGKIMNYMAQTFLYPTSFDVMLYASQLLQAEAIRYGVEHWRRNRGRCMGAIYWQINDCWPVASWSSIDYFGRWKALHYAAKRFFAPVLLSCAEEGILTQDTDVNAEPYDVKKAIQLNVSNETMSPVNARVCWALRSADGSVIEQGEDELPVPALTASWLDVHEFPSAPLYESYASYDMYMDGKWVSGGTALFCPPKHFRFADPELEVSVNGDEVTVTAKAYARSVELICEDGDVLLEDNYFDLNAGSRTVKILRGEGRKFSARSVYDIR